jgi:hypothetical protein
MCCYELREPGAIYRGCCWGIGLSSESVTRKIASEDRAGGRALSPSRVNRTARRGARQLMIRLANVDVETTVRD